MAQLDMYSSQLIRVIRAKGGATRQKVDLYPKTRPRVSLVEEECHSFSELTSLSLIYFMKLAPYLAFCF